jgi:hypothetical protein
MKSGQQQFYLKSENSIIGPISWQKLREWLMLEFLPKSVELAEKKTGPWLAATEHKKLWKRTIGIETKIQNIHLPTLVSEKLPVSAAQKERLKNLGWSWDASRIKNYYLADKLREYLEFIVTDKTLPPFDDPDWPWSFSSPAKQARYNQEVLKNPQLDWHNQPATAKQINRLRWWTQQLGLPDLNPTTKGEAHDLIDELLDEHPELETKWEIESERLQTKCEAEEEFELNAQEDYDEWREFYGCGKISTEQIRNVLNSIGVRKDKERINIFMDRFFAELKKQSPNLFVVKSAKLHQEKKGCLGILLVFVLMVFIAIGILVALD